MVILQASSGIGNRIWGWVQMLPPVQRWIRGWNDAAARSADIAPITLALYIQFAKLGNFQGIFSVALTSSLYVITGFSFFDPRAQQKVGESIADEVAKFSNDPSLYLASKLQEIGGSDATREITQSIGALVMDPVIGLFESYAKKENPDVHEFSRSFHGYMMSLSWGGGIIDSILKPILGDRAPNVTGMLNQLYWSMGLGFLGWQTLAPLLSSGLQPNLERYYNKLYRPERFNASQVRDLFALGKMSAAGVRDYLQEQGWRDDDIATWIEIGYRELSEGVIFDAFEKGLIAADQLQLRLRALGYNPADIPLIIRLHEREDENEATKFLLSTAKNSLKARKIEATEFREILSGLGYAPREIDLQIALLTEQREQEERELSIGQIRQIYEARIIGRDEAVHNLAQLRLSTQNAERLIAAWDIEAIPKAARINRSTIIDGYEAGALSRDQAMELLRAEAGYSSQNAELILTISEAQAAQAGAPAAEEGPAVSLSLLIQFAQNGLITRGQMEGRTELARFTPEDRQAFISLAFQTPVAEPAALAPDVLFDAFNRGAIPLEALRERLALTGLPPEDVELFIASRQALLSPSLLAEAYIFGVIDREDFASRLRGAGLSDADLEVFIRTVELQNPLVFGEFTAQFLRRPSVGSLQLALQRGLIDEAGFRDRLAALGYNQDAIEIYAFNAQYQAPASPKLLSKSDVIRLYRTEKISQGNALQRLVQGGYNIEDASLLLEAEELQPQDTEIGQAYLSGFVDQFGAAAALQEAGFSFEQIDAFFTAIELGEI